MLETPDSGAPPGAPIVHILPSNQPPWWVPSVRVLVVLGIFGLAARVLELIASNADLAKNTLFVTIATGLFGGSGIAAAIGYYLIASKKDAQPPGQGGAP